MRIANLAVIVMLSCFSLRADLSEFAVVAQRVNDAKKVVDSASMPLDVYNKLVDALLQHATPPKPGTPYTFSDLADNLTMQAAALDTLAPPPSFDSAPYQVSLGELSHCTTQRSALQKLNQYATDMESAARVGQGTSEDLGQFEKSIDLDRDLVEALEKASASAAELPEIGDYFANQWYELSTRLHPALNRLYAAVGRQKAIIDSNATTLSTSASNLRHNVALITPGKCLLSGTWVGSLKNEATGYVNRNFTLVFTESPEQATNPFGDYTLVTSNLVISDYTNVSADFNVIAHPPNPWYRIEGHFDESYSTLSWRQTCVNAHPPHPTGGPCVCDGTLSRRSAGKAPSLRGNRGSKGVDAFGNKNR